MPGIYRSIRLLNEQVTLALIPSHTDIRYNEEADQAAKRALRLPIGGHHQEVLQDLLELISARVWQTWDNGWKMLLTSTLLGTRASSVVPQVLLREHQ